MENSLFKKVNKLDFKQYNDRAIALTVQILMGRISPASIGLDMARKDNADAQREKEKITTITRNNVIEEERPILKKLCKLCLIADDYLKDEKIDLKKVETYDDIGVVYSEFAVPTYEEKLKVLQVALEKDAISPEEYVERLYGDKKSKAEKDKEVAYLKDRIKLKSSVYEVNDNESDSDSGKEKGNKT